MLATTAVAPQTFELAEQVGLRLQQKQQTVCTAESCTGGGIGYAITEVAGSSAWFNGGIITYTNALKQKLLSVETHVLEEHGAVSEACVEQMASGALSLCGADWSIAVSGVAGPGGGTADKPVGLVWMAITNHKSCWTWHEHFSGNRAEIRLKTMDSVLNKLINIIELQ
ncbi:CinA family protein [Idiomarina abyssalis]|uniref:CinA family protein n=1 Tax=Idiomarina abyssalis TaxID=86102 RepID=UPI0006C8436B|nr:CinA family protein [Idiomarina abyssalis]KPD22761.1 damage-inducible protein CinA [Idiomarina abyssalis]SFT47186.1 nicotinamide-nucleotide amidase [Idiomarina abyssalis]